MAEMAILMEASFIDVSVAIYASINIAIAGPHSTAVADQTNDVQIDRRAVQIAGAGGDGGNGNLALGGSCHTSFAGSPLDDVARLTRQLVRSAAGLVDAPRYARTRTHSDVCDVKMSSRSV
jgi:hypothetical protein